MLLHIARIIDANANRAREAMRVMEDGARFALDDADLSAQLKLLRHDFREAISLLPDGWIEANRDTPGDVGTAISTASERERASAADVVIASGKRLTEALRAIEEYGKTLCPEMSERIEAIRYRAYDLESRLHTRLGAGEKSAPSASSHSHGAPQWRLCVLVSESLCRRPWLDVVDAAIEGGADCIQLREKDLTDGKLLGRATAVVKRCRDADVSCVINDRLDIAALSHADGVHLGQTDLPVGHARRMCGRTMIIGVSTTNVVQAEAAVRSGADYVGLGPMFVTATKVKPSIAGPGYAREFLAKFSLPHLAIGGINTSNVASLVESGVRGVAVSSAVCSADDPADAARRILTAMNDAGPAESTS